MYVYIDSRLGGVPTGRVSAVGLRAAGGVVGAAGLRGGGAACAGPAAGRVALLVAAGHGRRRNYVDVSLPYNHSFNHR